eukprot:scaffold15059_cov146-Skeletonema_menzelii.AAC.17
MTARQTTSSTVQADEGTKGDESVDVKSARLNRRGRHRLRAAALNLKVPTFFSHAQYLTVLVGKIITMRGSASRHR